MRIIALVPFKLNSERVPNKNFRILNGKPLYWWVLETLATIGSIDKIIINTDARQEIERHGLPPNADIVIKDRKPHLCGDFVNMNLILEDDINEFEADFYLMTHTTNPFVKSATFEQAINSYVHGLTDESVDSVFSVNKLQSRLYNKYLAPMNHQPDQLKRTQDLDPIYEENSCFYIFSALSFQLHKSRIGVKPTIAVSSRLESLDIDNEDDWLLAETISKGLS